MTLLSSHGREKQKTRPVSGCDGPCTLGVDIGSASIAYVLTDTSLRIQKTGYLFHNGDIHQSLEGIFASLPVPILQSIGVNDPGAEFFTSCVPVNNQVALIEGVRHCSITGCSILYAGAERYGLILFDERGEYSRFISNTGCAAGTGSFLEQQAMRLGLKDAAELSRLASGFTGDPPTIATRCAVFAKTDLVHAQQKGYSLAAICAGLCRGVAQNIVDTVRRGISLPDTMIFCGGVALNHKVLEEIRALTGKKIILPEMPEKLEAFGAACIASRTQAERVTEVASLNTLLRTKPNQKKYHYPPLKTHPYRLSGRPLFQKLSKEGVETEIYIPFTGQAEWPVYMGIDVGSTSTKMMLMGPDREMKAGFYTRTLGQPIDALQRLLRAMEKLERRFGMRFRILSAGATGSGRKLIHHVLGTSQAIDEITAHARAAFHLNPETDTIIEIGGQDSKFTLMEEGRVVFSVMNYVCAAGTGSFLEEQAHRLGVSLEEYSEAAEQVSAPLTSDRCTVFMERDLNFLLSLGYSRAELLASALHSVRDNYLAKVGQRQKIGKTISFQGATGKNAALVKAFEQKLQKPIFVSPYCHLTGAMGVCLLLKDRKTRLPQRFRTGFAHEKVEVGEVTCEDCSNHCTLLRMEIGTDIFVWGRLCGKEEGARRKRVAGDADAPWVVREKVLTQGIELPPQPAVVTPASPARAATVFQSVLKSVQIPVRGFLNRLPVPIHLGEENAAGMKRKASLRIGIPNTLNFMDTLPLWKRFFENLGHRVVTSVSSPSLMILGKTIAAAEFCAPLVHLHGHVQWLLNHCDYVFAPMFFENEIAKLEKKYCYYSNYAVTILKNNLLLSGKERLLTPVLENGPMDARFHVLEELPEEVKNGTAHKLKAAFDEASAWFSRTMNGLRELTRHAIQRMDEMGIVLLGRPYLALDPRMNGHVPDRLMEMGIPVFYQDMLPVDAESLIVGPEYLAWNHWYYGDVIIQAAEQVARMPHLFPIYMTAFKCSPDSFMIPYFKDMMSRYDKPYLILQLDEHYSVEGYDTRLEAAVETFKNFRKKQRTVAKPEIVFCRKLKNKTYLLPNYDPLSMELKAAAFKRHGFDAQPIIETEETIQNSVHINDGQCLPISALTQGIAHTIQQRKLDPEKTAFFINSLCDVPCNLPQYPVLIKQQLEQMGNGLDKVEVVVINIQMSELPLPLLIDVYYAYLLGGLVYKMACKKRPRELNQGMTDRVLEESIAHLAEAIEKNRPRESAFQDVVKHFMGIAQDSAKTDLPKVAIIGDQYVRDNHVFNQDLIREVEHAGAEVIPTPYSFLVRMSAAKHFHRLAMDKKYMPLVFEKTVYQAVSRLDKKYFRYAVPVLQESFPQISEVLTGELQRYHMTLLHPGETSQNLEKIFHLLDQYSDIRLFIHVNPVFCCPALISESVFKHVEQEIGIPIVSITYDGTKSRQNEILKPYLHFITEKMGVPAHGDHWQKGG